MKKKVAEPTFRGVLERALSRNIEKHRVVDAVYLFGYVCLKYGIEDGKPLSHEAACEFLTMFYRAEPGEVENALRIEAMARGGSSDPKERRMAELFFAETRKTKNRRKRT